MDDPGLRRLLERVEAPMPPTLEPDLRARIASPSARRSLRRWRWPAAAAAVLLLVTVGVVWNRYLNGNDDHDVQVTSTDPTPPEPALRTTTTVATGPDQKVLKDVSVAGVSGLLRAGMSDTSPLLTPAAIPSDWRADVTTRGNSFSVRYHDPEGLKVVTLEISIPNPPTPTDRTDGRRQAFRGYADAYYQVDDRTDPASPRQLLWREPGQWSDPIEPEWSGGVPYYLTSEGITDAEFWAIAGSLHVRQPTVEVTPSTGVHDGQTVTVHLTSFGPGSKGRFHAVGATSWASASDGFIQPRVCRGRLLSL